jgi:hypothetical protein
VLVEHTCASVAVRGDCFTQPCNVRATTCSQHQVWHTNTSGTDLFWMYFPAVNGPAPGVGVAVSKTGPTGPFTDVLGKALVSCPGGGGDDPTVFVDDSTGLGCVGGWQDAGCGCGVLVRVLVVEVVCVELVAVCCVCIHEGRWWWCVVCEVGGT